MPILSVKLKMPQPRKNYIIRQKLFGKLANIKEYKVVIVKAGAGSGKTTLLSSFVKETNMKSVKWITLYEDANQSFVFWNYVIEAVKEYFRDTRMDFQTFYDSNMQEENLWQILSLLVNKLGVEEDIILVLDDFQVISDPFLISTIDYFIDNMPNNMHLVLLTREMPDIYLGALAVEDKILVMDEEFIRLTKDESRKFLTDTLKLDKEEKQLKSMIEASEGWIGGLQLLAIAAKDKKDQIIPSIKVSNRLLEDYITKEIFLFLTREEQDFLVETAILGYFSEQICSKYQPEVNFLAMIESILQKNLFVINIDDVEGVYRYHAILSDYLQGLFDRYSKEKKHKLHDLAADIYSKLGDYEESLHHLFIIKDYEKIMDLILDMPQTALTFAYLMKVPMEEISKNKDFAYQYFFYYYASLDEQACERIYNFIKENMKEDKTFAAFNHSDMFFCDKWELDRINILSLSQINELPLNPITSAFLLIKEAYFLFAATRYQEAMEYLNRAGEVYKKTGNIYIGYFVLAEKAQILEDMGELNACFTLYKEIETMISKFKTASASYYIGIAGVHMKQLAFKETFQALEKAKEMLPKDASAVDRAYQYTLAEYSYMIGDEEVTEKMLADILGFEIYKNIYFSARILRYPICRGNHKELAKQFVKDYEAASDAVKIMDSDLLYAIILYENGDVKRSMQIVDTLIGKARKTQNKLKIIEGDLLKTHMLIDSEGDKRDIQNLFLEAVSYATENRIALPFWFEKKTVNKVLSVMKAELQKKLSVEEFEFLSSILKTDARTGISEDIKHRNDLTGREKEVLNELAKGSSNKQIAEILYISLPTVKSHIINIYGKLGVNNRVAAVNKIKRYNR